MTNSAPPSGASGESAPSTPTPGSAPGNPSAAKPGPLDKKALAALQAVMAAEHAALWSYGLVTAYDPEVSDTVTTMVSSHQDVRDVAANLIVQGGATPVGPAPAYRTPERVHDAKSALALALTIEQNCAQAWSSVIGLTDGSTLRGTALSALTDCALRMVTWRQTAKDKVTTVPFPGAPDLNEKFG